MKYVYDESKKRLSVYLDEELDIHECRTIRNIIDSYIIKYEPEEFIMDFSNVKFMDSSGIGLLIGRYNLIKLLDSKMTVINVDSSIKRVIELSSVSKYITVRSE
ncbi:MAG: anti-sigma factor antagonist [Clostridia bacterium]|nr:anti-sigma factor antagonist [Clostridia bacterium]